MSAETKSHLTKDTVLLGFLSALLIVSIYALASRPPDRGGAAKHARVSIAGREFFAELANTPALRLQGLSGRNGVGEKEGMLFVFDTKENHAFWMKDMNFPIDIVWIEGNRVVGFAEDARPEPGIPTTRLRIYSPPEPIDRVLEIRAGRIQALGLAVGDGVSVSLER